MILSHTAPCDRFWSSTTSRMMKRKMRFRSAAEVVGACQSRGRFSPSACSPARSVSLMGRCCPGLDGLILAPCPFGLVSGALSSERPLPIELPALFLQLPDCRECDRNSIGCKGLKEYPLDQFIHRQGADLLAQGAASLALVGSAAVDRIIAIRPRVPQAHATPAAPANSDALQ